MTNINFDLKVHLKKLVDNSVYFSKNFMFYVNEGFLGQNYKKSHNIENHLEDFKQKIKINNLPLVNENFSKYNIHYVDYGMNIGNEINGIRPSVIFKNNRYSWGYDTIVIPLSSLYKKDGTEKRLDKLDIIIQPDEYNNLKKSSILRVRQLRNISKIRIGRKIGCLHNSIDGISLYDLIDKKIKAMFSL